MTLILRQYKIISNKRNTSRRFDRINNTSSKFTIKADSQYNDDYSMTVLDSIFDQLSENDIEEHSITTLKQYVNDQEYDTESIEIDLEINNGNGNLSAITDQNCINTLITMFEQSRRMFYLYLFFFFYFFFLLFFFIYSAFLVSLIWSI